MPETQELPKVKNGFKIIKDLGLYDNGIRYAQVICKECGNKFNTSIYHINIIKSCGCLPCRPPKDLPKVINGFKVLKDLGYSNGSRRAIAECKVCNREYEVDPNKLKYRKHCGCIVRGTKVCSYSKSYPIIVQAYNHMMGRCYRKKNKDYALYSSKGIIVCEKWKGNMDTFCEWAIITGWKKGLSLDRIDSTGNYEPSNCRWADAKTQARNTSRNVLTMESANMIRQDVEAIKSLGLSIKANLKKLARKYKVSEGTIISVLYTKAWT
jgi:hypothetical protein